jgi:hypothetical protein
MDKHEICQFQTAMSFMLKGKYDKFSKFDIRKYKTDKKNLQVFFLVRLDHEHSLNIR